MVRRKDGSNRVCVDFGKLSKITEVDPGPMMPAENLSKIDLSNGPYGYWQILVAPQDVYKTAFVTPDGQYEFLRMPFGMVNSGATLVQGLKKLLEGLSGVCSYIDGIVVYNGSWGNMLGH